MRHTTVDVEGNTYGVEDLAVLRSKAAEATSAVLAHREKFRTAQPAEYRKLLDEATTLTSRQAMLLEAVDQLLCIKGALEWTDEIDKMVATGRLS